MNWQEQCEGTWGKLFDTLAGETPDQEALIWQGMVWTYAQLQEQVNHVAKSLLHLGIQHGDHVALWMTNRPEWIFTQLAIYKVGASMVPISTRFGTSELEYILRQSGASLLIMADEFLGSINAVEILASVCPEAFEARGSAVKSRQLPLLRNIICLESRGTSGLRSFDQFLKDGNDISDTEVTRAQDRVSPDNTAHIMYTSGTTGFPKGAMISHRSSIACMRLMADYMDIIPGERMLGCVPLFSNFGAMGIVGTSLTKGAAMVVQETFSPGEVLYAFEKEDIRHFLCVPTMLVMMLDHPELPAHRYRLKTILSAGAPLSKEVISGVHRLMAPRQILNAYGLVEATAILTMTHPLDKLEQIERTVGKSLPNCEVKIVDPVTGHDLPAGSQGEIVSRDLHRGTHLMKSYYNMPEETGKTIDSKGWLHTGDLGILREDGYLQITGRAKEMFLVGGFNVYPVEIENFLSTHPKIKQVAVVGVPDKRLGEVGMAFIMLKEGMNCTEAEVINFSRGKIANVKVPRYVRFVSEFPLTGPGKIQKFKLREIGIKELGLE